MEAMFSKLHLFNQPIGNWDVSNVTDMSVCLHGANSLTNLLEIGM